MTAPFPYGIEVEVERGTRNDFGDLTYTVTHTIGGCAYAPRETREDNDGRATTIIRPRLFGPYGADLRPDDRVVLPGTEPRARRTFRVIGQPAQWRSPWNGWTPGFEAELEQVA